MTRKHFKEIANCLRELKPVNEVQVSGLMQWELTVERFADMYAASNSTFRREQFLDACGYNDD